jgi:cyanophycinase
MKRLGTLKLIIAAVASLGAAPQASRTPNPGYAYYEIGNLGAPRRESAERALLLVGGGDWNLEAFRWFAAKTGHGHLVVIAAYGDGEDGKYFYRDIGGFASVQTLVFSSRKASYDPRVLRILRNADGIFIAGGDQSKYVRFWKGTPVATAINGEVARGRPVGGTSAGLAVLGAYAYGAMDGGSIDSPTALGNPLGPAVTMVRDFLRMPFLSHVVTDTHFAARNRLGRSIAFLANVRTKWDPSAVGLAIDQDSALCVDLGGVGRFFTNKEGKAWLLQPMGMPHAVRGEPLDWKSIRITRFGPRGAIDLKSMRVSGSSSTISISVDHGHLQGI